MATASRAAARATLVSLRRQIVSIEGGPAAAAGGDRGWDAAGDAVSDETREAVAKAAAMAAGTPPIMPGRAAA